MNPYSNHILSAALENGRVVLRYQMGLAEGITLYCRRGQEPDFTEFADDEPSPLVDDRPKLDPTQPETRHYRAVLLYSGEENRQMSNEVALTLP